MAIFVASYALGQAAIIKKITITGNTVITQQSILTKMRLHEGGVFSLNAAQQDEAALNDWGYFQVAKVISKPMDGGDVEVRVEVIENPVIKEIQVTGNTLFSTEDITKALSLVKGQILNVRNIKPSVDSITKLYRDKGYFCTFDKFDVSTESPETFSIGIVEATVKSVTVTGKRRTKDKVMKRLIRTRPGDKFNENSWTQDVQRVFNTQWFEDVIPAQPEAGDLGLLDLKLEVKETRTGNAQFGVTLDPRNSLAGTMRVSESNLNGTGQSVNANYFQSPSGGGPSIDLGYGNPFWDSKNTAFNINVFSRVLFRFTGTQFGGSSSPTNDNRYIERRTGLSVGFSRPTRQTFNTLIGGRFERIKTGDITTSSNDFIKQDGDIASVTLGFISNRRDVDLDPARGDYLAMNFEPGLARITDVGGQGIVDGILGSHVFGKMNFDFRKYFSKQPARTARTLADPRRAWALRLRGGIVSGTVPFFEQYFAGGAESIRGYQEDRFWGKYQLIGTVEYRNPLVTKDGRSSGFSLIPFVDYGGAWGGFNSLNNFTQSKSMRLHLGYGMGVAFKTPLGPIRLDYGINEQRGSRLHFLIATAF